MIQRFSFLLIAGILTLAATLAQAQSVAFQLDEADAAAPAEQTIDESFVGDDPNAPGYSPMVEHEKSAPAKKKVVAVAPPEPQDIPLIETKNVTVTHADVSYVTGGVGEDEKKSIEAASADYNLQIMSATVEGAFVGDARVVIRQGDTVMLDVVAGPLLYVRLPVGTYELEAALGTQSKKQKFSITKATKAKRVHLAWKRVNVEN